MKRAIVFAHFDRDGLIDAYVHYFLSSLRPYAHTLIFVSTSASENELEKLNHLCDIAITRENCGYDFMSWKIGLDYLSSIHDFDEITFINDSIYGPLSSLEHLFNAATKKPTDFWGLARCHQQDSHIQSYFFSFRRNLITQGIFSRFWNDVTTLDSKDEIISRYEIGLSQQLNTEGYATEVIFDPKQLSLWARIRAALINGSAHHRTLWHTIHLNVRNRRSTNPAHRFWRSLIEAGAPFIKVELMRSNPHEMDLQKIRAYLANNTTYDINLIDDHIQRTQRP